MSTAAPAAPAKEPVLSHDERSESAIRRRRMLPLVILLIVSLVLTGVTQNLAYHKRESLQTTQRSERRLSGVDTFALGLILGGLRGPLIMFLWPSIESQKIDRNLEDIDTKIELVRMLQPEFDSVHLFQIWNKAYNISVQMASIPNKYTTILDALRYAKSVDDERPDNVNILSAYGEVYFNKLGNSAEKRPFIKRIRTESMASAAGATDAARQRRDSTLQKQRHEVLLDAKGFLLAEYLTPRWERGGTVPQDLRAAGYTGAPLQYLARYNTPEMGGFPYGVSPIAIGYNYYERAALLARVTGRKHIHVGDAVIDSRPAVTLKFWVDEEMDRARRLEISLAGKQQPDDRADKWLLDPPTADLAMDAPLALKGAEAKAAVEEALFSLKRAVQAGDHAIAEYRRHIDAFKFSPNASNFESHIDSIRATVTMARADEAYLELLASAQGLIPPRTDVQRRQLIAKSMEHYTRAVEHHYGVLLRFYVEEDVAAAVYPVNPNAAKPGERYAKTNILSVPAKEYAGIFAATRQFLAANKRGDYFREDVGEHLTYIDRASKRLEQLKKLQ